MKLHLFITFVIVGMFYCNIGFAQEEMLFLRGQDILKSESVSQTTVAPATSSESFMMVSPRHQYAVRNGGNNGEGNTEKEKEEKSSEKPAKTPATQTASSSNPASTQSGSQSSEVSDDESALDMNFLYILIQKFKVSEILD